MFGMCSKHRKNGNRTHEDHMGHKRITWLFQKGSEVMNSAQVAEDRVYSRFL